MLLQEITIRQTPYDSVASCPKCRELMTTKRIERDDFNHTFTTGECSCGQHFIAECTILYWREE